jgi:hypothetical protein
MSELSAGVAIEEAANDPAFERTFVAALAFPMLFGGELRPWRQTRADCFQIRDCRRWQCDAAVLHGSVAGMIFRKSNIHTQNVIDVSVLIAHHDYVGLSVAHQYNGLTFGILT